MPHDQLFKELLETFFDDFLHLVVPDLVPHLDLARYRKLSPEQFTDFPHGDRRLLDLLVEVPVRGDTAANDEVDTELVFVHVEVERDARAEMGRRMWEYSRTLSLRGRRPVLPIVLYLRGGPPGITEQTVREELFGRTLATFHYLAFGLSGSDAERFLATDLPLASGLAALMRTPPGWNHTIHRLNCLQAIAGGMRRSPSGDRPLTEIERDLLGTCVRDYLTLDDEERKEYEMQTERREDHDTARTPEAPQARQRPEGERTLELLRMSRAEQIALAFKKDLVRGSEEEKMSILAEIMLAGETGAWRDGKTEGMRDLVLGMLDRRFGALSDDVRTRVAQLDAEKLRALSLDILDATSLDDLDLG